MRIISLYQPYATLMVMGLKRNETRSWDTKYRGQLGIHATANMPSWCRALLKEEPFYTQIGGLDLPMGCIIGCVEVVNTLNTEDWLFKASDPKLSEAEFARNEMEMAFGDYDLGRFAWETINPVRFVNPIPARGSQGFWNFDLVHMPVLP